MALISLETLSSSSLRLWPPLSRGNEATLTAQAGPLYCGWKISLGGKLQAWFTYFPLTGDGIMDRLVCREIELNDAERRIYERLEPLFEEERRRMARALASGPLFGEKEYELRDRVHNLGYHAGNAPRSPFQGFRLFRTFRP
jgi:hypothetical protein